jgi:glycosyltransferase involved in cell wall biosynthesis
MRILHVVTLVDDQSSYGGPLTVAINQCRELIRRGHDARILAGWAGSGAIPSKLEGVPAHLFKVRKVVPGMRFSSLLSLSMIGWLRRNARNFDVAHLHTARDLVPLSAGALFRRAGIPYTTQTHGMVLPDARLTAKIIDGLFTLRVLRHATARFVLTDIEDDAIRTLLGTATPTVRLPNGIAVHDGVRDTTDPLDVLFMARLHPRKRVMDFAQAARTLIEEGHSVQFSVVGPDDGDLPRLEEFIAAHPTLLGRLTYEGSLPHDNAVPRLAQAGLFVLPSIDEPFPMTLLEALAVGTPSICTTSCGVASDLALADAALVIEPGVASLESALRLLVTNPARRSALSIAARQTARTRYSMLTVGVQLLTVYTREGSHTLT